ncbi:uncharacterized protein LOC132306872 [Cornus florida]|uniref:uncharacterized protein LOC132306872 n=1 Tax=Cornus florida TaxID=4283 RepID=UPI00289819A5|nr:uncharacterized protein LOC132306872 [Cornus florida]
MPFSMKIQPIDFNTPPEGSVVPYEPGKPVVKSRLKRLFERQFPNVLRTSVTAEKTGGGGGGGVGVEEPCGNKDGSGEFDPSSVCLAKMVQNFIEDSNEKPAASVRCGRHRCNCFNGNRTESSEDELDSCSCFGDSNLTSCCDASEILKSLVPCASVSERNLLADTAKIVEKNKICKRKDDYCRRIVTDALLALGYDASICKSRWEKASSYPAGEYEYVDAIVDGERLIIDIDFRSEFEIARSTKTYKTILQILPYIFVGKSDRLQRMVSIVSEAAKQSLKKKGMHFPPWRKAEYVKAKWLSPYTRTTPTPTPTPSPSPILVHSDSIQSNLKSENKVPLIRTKKSSSSSSESELNFGEKSSPVETNLGDDMFTLSESSSEGEKSPAVKQWEPREIKPKSSQVGVKIVTGLASVIGDEP